jgi:diaminopimelate decarboxylase
VTKRAGETTYDVVGPDLRDRRHLHPRPRPAAVGPGDLVAFMSAGAYGAAMASEYNTRPLVPEVLVDGDRFAVIRARPSYEEMLAGI